MVVDDDLLDSESLEMPLFELASASRVLSTIFKWCMVPFCRKLRLFRKYSNFRQISFRIGTHTATQRVHRLKKDTASYGVSATSKRVRKRRNEWCSNCTSSKNPVGFSAIQAKWWSSCRCLRCRKFYFHNPWQPIRTIRSDTFSPISHFRHRQLLFNLKLSSTRSQTTNNS